MGKLDVGDVLAMVVTTIIAGIGGAVGLFRSSKNKRDAQVGALEGRMEKYEAVRAAQATQLAVLETCQANIQEKLEEIREDIQRTANAGAHSVNTQLAAVLTEVQNMRANLNRRT